MHGLMREGRRKPVLYSTLDLDIRQSAGTSSLVGWAERIQGKQEMRPVVMASVCVLGFISLSPTYPDR